MAQQVPSTKWSAVNYRLILLFCLMFSALYAQPPMNNCNFSPVPGDSLKGITYSYDTAGVTSKNSGASVTWDYSTLLLDTTYLLSHHYFTAASSPWPSFFPKAQIADLTPVNVYSYYTYSADSSVYWGDYTSAANCNILTDPQQLLKCPLPFSQYFNDTYGGNDCASTPYSGKRKTTYDAYGTLILPAITFNNTARLQIVDSMTKFSILYVITTYNWIDVNDSRVVFSIIITDIPSFMLRYKSVLYFAKQTIPTVIPELSTRDENISIYPNPVTGSATVKLNVNRNLKDGRFIITDLLGRNVKTVANITTPEFVISKEKIPQGIYFCTFYEGDILVGKEKIVVE